MGGVPCRLRCHDYSPTWKRKHCWFPVSIGSFWRWLWQGGPGKDVRLGTSFQTRIFPDSWCYDEWTWWSIVEFGGVNFAGARLETTTCRRLRQGRTYSKLSRDFYWPRMGRYVAKYVKTCKVCQLAKGSKTLPFPLQPLPVPSKPWESISMDFITCLPTSSGGGGGGNDTILTFVDRLTKQAHFVPTKGSINASGTADLYIENVFCLHGLSQSIVSVRDPRFTSDLYKAIFEKLGVHLSFSTSNHPQTDGQTERTHRTIEQILRTAVNHRQTNWEDLLPASEFAFNDMVQASTCETPFFFLTTDITLLVSWSNSFISSTDILWRTGWQNNKTPSWLQKTVSERL